MSDLGSYRVLGPIAYMGKKGCTDMRCRRYFGPDGMSDDCIGYHCSYCDAPCSMMGHRCDVGDTLLAESRRLQDEEAA